MTRNLVNLWAILLGAVAQLPSAVGQDFAKKDDSPRSRTFRFDYGATLNDLPVGSRVRVWLPVPQSSDHQSVSAVKQDLPAAGKTGIEPVYGNKILYFEIAGPASRDVPFTTSYRVRRDEVRGLATGDGKFELTDRQRRLFLCANRLVPLTGKQLDLLQDISFSNDHLDVARTLYGRVDDFVKYDKSRPGYGNGDVLWVCDSRSGNCTDFHSLFISWSRAKGVPARFEIGFPLPPERGEGTVGGYHCWAFFHSSEKGWVPVDISEADKHPDMREYFFGSLTENRVAFTTGRDINLVPLQAGEPLNFFVYPYVEVDDRPWPKEKISLSFSYADVDQGD